MLLVAALGCGTEQPELPPPTPSWVATLATDASTFTAVMEPGRDGWIALHANDPRQAVSLFADQAHTRARAEWQLAVLHADLASLSAAAHLSLFTAWEARGTLPESGVLMTIAALSEQCDGGTGARWASRADGAGAALVTSVAANGGRPWELSTAPRDAVEVRMGLHQRARAGDLEALEKASLTPLLSETGDGFTRELYDPCAHSSLSAGWSKRVATSLAAEDWRGAAAWADDGMSGLLFSPWATADELRETMATAAAPGLPGSVQPLGLPANLPGDADIPDAARDEVRSLGDALTTEHEALAAAGSEDGLALLAELGLEDRFRQEVLVVRARAALAADRPAQALAYLELARDVTDHAVGPLNSASLFVLMASANLRLGHTREALDTLTPAAAHVPAAAGVREIVADLAVLQSLDRQGDSKED